MEHPRPDFVAASEASSAPLQRRPTSRGRRLLTLSESPWSVGPIAEAPRKLRARLGCRRPLQRAGVPAMAPIREVVEASAAAARRRHRVGRTPHQGRGLDLRMPAQLKTYQTQAIRVLGAYRALVKASSRETSGRSCRGSASRGRDRRRDGCGTFIHQADRNRSACRIRTSAGSARMHRGPAEQAGAVD